MNKQFPAVEIKVIIKALPPSAHGADPEMEPRHHVPVELRMVATTLIEPITPMENIWFNRHRT